MTSHSGLRANASVYDAVAARLKGERMDDAQVNCDLTHRTMGKRRPVERELGVKRRGVS